MADLRMLKNTQIIILGVCIVIATIVSSIIFSKGFLKVMRFTREVITVTGSAQKEIISDMQLDERIRGEVLSIEQLLQLTENVHRLLEQTSNLNYIKT